MMLTPDRAEELLGKELEKPGFHKTITRTLLARIFNLLKEQRAEIEQLRKENARLRTEMQAEREEIQRRSL